MRLVPHLAAVRPLGFVLDETRFLATAAWLAAMRAHSLFRADAKRTARFFSEVIQSGLHERRRIGWRGDRIEWLLARGFHEWFIDEIRAERAFFPD